MTVNMIFDKTRYLALMPANKISHNNGMAQLPLAISGKPFTTMKKALFHGRLRVFGEKMNTSVCLCSMFPPKTTRYSILSLKKRNPSTRQKPIFGSCEPFTSTANRILTLWDISPIILNETEVLVCQLSATFMESLL
jgi:hypothetical protein